MGQRADGYVVHAGFGHGTDVVEANTSTGFQARAAGDAPHGLPEIGKAEVVQQDAIGTCVQSLLHLLQGVGFDLDLQVGPALPCPCHGCGHRVGFGVLQDLEMVVLDQDQVVEAEAVVVSAATTYGVLFELPPPGCGLARVEDPRAGAGHRTYEAGRQRGNAGKALHEVQCDPFGRQQGPGRPFDLQEHRARLETLAIPGAGSDSNRATPLPERFDGQRQPRHDQRLPRAHDGARARPGRDQRQRGGIATPDVLAEGVANEPAHLPWMKSIHGVPSWNGLSRITSAEWCGRCRVGAPPASGDPSESGEQPDQALQGRIHWVLLGTMQISPCSEVRRRSGQIRNRKMRWTKRSPTANALRSGMPPADPDCPASLLRRPVAFGVVLGLVIQALWAGEVRAGSGAGDFSVPEVGPVPEDLRARLQLDPFYRKHLDAGGLPVLGSRRVSNAALREAAWILGHMLAGRPEWLARMGERGARVVVMAHDEYTTDVPEHARLRPKIYWDRRARGLGGRTTSCGEENLLGFPGDPYAGECILIHEFSHALHNVALRRGEPGFQETLERLFEQARREGRWTGTYAASNPEEYWAEAVQSWFDCNRENDASHNHVNTREELQAYDPGLAQLCERVFGTNPWRYRRPWQRPAAERVHLAGYDPARAPRFHWPDPPLGERAVVRFDTPLGSFEAELYARQAPQVVRHFLGLVRDGFYREGSLRWIPAVPGGEAGAYIEGGTDPARLAEQPSLDDGETPARSGLRHLRGTLTWVLGGAEDGRGRFRICREDRPDWDNVRPEQQPEGPGLAPFGRVIRGMDLLESWAREVDRDPAGGSALRLQGVYRME